MAATREDEEMTEINSSSPRKVRQDSSPGTSSRNLLPADQIEETSKPCSTWWWNLFLLGKKNLILLLSVLAMFLGFTSGVLLMRFYFANGGSRKWLYTWTQTGGWPLSVLGIVIMYCKKNLRLAPITPKLACAYLVLGGLLCIDNYMYAWGIAYMSASTNALLSSSQLVFNAIFACLLNRQKITAYGYNAIALVTTSAIILAIHSDNDKPAGVTKRQYVAAYIMTIASAALYGFIFPLIELVFRKFMNQEASNEVILQVQAYISFIATVWATLGMAVNHDFSAMHAESLRFKAGQAGYFVAIFWTTVTMQLAFLGSVGAILLSSSLLAGVCLAVSLPLSSILAVVFFHDNFGALKIIAMFLSVWGFMSYTYGGYLETKKASEVQQTEMMHLVPSASHMA